MTITLGYARVSTLRQFTEGQVEALKKAGAEEIFEEKTSGRHNAHSRTFRDLYDRVRVLLSEGSEVRVIVTKLDRFGRNTPSVISSVLELAEMGASFEAIQTGFRYEHKHPHSKFQLTMLAALAELEREMIADRIEDGKLDSKERGMPNGPEPKHTHDEVVSIREDVASKRFTFPEIARRYNTSVSTIKRITGGPDMPPYIPREEWLERKAKAKRARKSER